MRTDCSRRLVLGALGASGLTPGLALARQSSPLYRDGSAGSRGICTLALSPAGDRLATAGIDGWVRLWDAASVQPVHSRQVSSEEALCIAWSPDGARIAVGTAEAALHVLSAADLSPVSQTACEAMVTGVGFTADGAVVSTGPDGDLTLTAGGGVRRVLPDVGGWSMTVSPDGRFAAVGGPTRLIDLADGAVTATQGPATREIHAIAFSADGSLVVSTHWSGEIRLWRPAGGAPPTVLRPMIAFRAAGPRNAMPVEAPVPMAGLAVSPDGKVVAVGAADRKLRFWDAATGALLSTSRAHGRTIAAMAYSPDGARLFTADLGGTVRVWTVPGGVLPDGQGL